MFPHGSYLSGDVAASQASDRIGAAEMKTRGRHGGDQSKGRLTRQTAFNAFFLGLTVKATWTNEKTRFLAAPNTTNRI